MQFRDPTAVIDEVIADLDYLTEFFLEDIDHGGIDATPRAMKAVAALEAARTLLPRLRIVRSNFVSDSRLPDASAGFGLLSGGANDAGTDSASQDAAPPRIQCKRP